MLDLKFYKTALAITRYMFHPLHTHTPHVFLPLGRTTLFTDYHNIYTSCHVWIQGLSDLKLFVHFSLCFLFNLIQRMCTPLPSICHSHLYIDIFSIKSPELLALQIKENGVGWHGVRAVSVALKNINTTYEKRPK